MLPHRNVQKLGECLSFGLAILLFFPHFSQLGVLLRVTYQREHTVSAPVLIVAKISNNLNTVSAV